MVQTTYGPMIGEEMNVNGFLYKAFRGIPYAAPPVGNLRFKDPQPPANWTGVRVSQEVGFNCVQPKANGTSEDCLYLNVFTTSLARDSSMPVLVWIHGGGFRKGSGGDGFYNPYWLLKEDIVFVSLNYRLGPLGFLATNTSDASGNWGMKDQVAALRWVQENIVNFGGDPNKVTIYGESAGGSSVHLLSLSQLAKGLFHGVIASSGTGINDWAMITKEQASRFSMNLARLLGASEDEITDPAKRVEFLRKADPQAMADKARELPGKEDSGALAGFFPFAPVVENQGTPGAFMTEEPKKIIQEGKFLRVPMMIGANDLESGNIEKTTIDYINTIENNVCEIFPKELKNAIVARNECVQVRQVIKDAYFEGKPFNSSIQGFAYLGGDRFMGRDVYKTQRLHAPSSTPDAPIYNYLFAFDGDWNIMKKALRIHLPGAIHGDELGYIFMTQPRNDTDQTPEVTTKNRMVRLIGNFVKYGNPTPTQSDLIPCIWEPVTADVSKTMVIRTDMMMENDFLKIRMDAWDGLCEKYTGSPLC